MASWISAADVAAYLGLDDLVQAQQLADAATSLVQDALARDLEQREYDELYSTSNTDYVMLNNGPVTEVTFVSLDGYPQPIQPAAFRQGGWRIDPMIPTKLQFVGFGRLGRSLVPNIQVVYTAGYPIGTPPDPKSSPSTVGTGLPVAVHEALKLTASALWNAQASDPNLLSESTAGVFSGMFQQAGVGAVPPGALTMLSPYQSYGLVR